VANCPPPPGAALAFMFEFDPTHTRPHKLHEVIKKHTETTTERIRIHRIRNNKNNEQQMKMKWPTTAAMTSLVLGGALQSTTGTMTSHNLRGGMRSLHSVASRGSNLRAPNAGAIGTRSLYSADYNYFGHSVSISGNTYVVAAPEDDEHGYVHGAAYVYEYNPFWGGFDEQAKLFADDGAERDIFGLSVAISGDTLVIGAPGDDTKAIGSAYVFERNGDAWTQQARINSGDKRFGWSVAISGDNVVVGTDQASGAAYVFERNGGAWTQRAKLIAANGAAGTFFGWSVAIYEDTVLVGAPQDSNNKGMASGSVYVFVRSEDTWTQRAKLLAADGAAGDYFGLSLSISGDTVLVGAPEDDDKGMASGSVYLFERSGGTWTETKLVADDGAAGDYFGESVSISGDRIVVGAPGDDDKGLKSGSVYLFEGSGGTWTKKSKLVADDGAAGDYFGECVSISEDKMVVGAPYHDGVGVDSGSYYLFQV